MLAVSGLFAPVYAMPGWLQLLSKVLPLTPAVSLLRGVWVGDGWLAHGWDVAALVLIFSLSTALSTRVFRWV